VDTTTPTKANVMHLKLANKAKEQEKTKQEITKKKWDIERNGKLYKMKIAMSPCGLDITYSTKKSFLDMVPKQLRDMLDGATMIGAPGDIEEQVIHVHVHHAKWQKFLGIKLSWLAKRELKRIRKVIDTIIEQEGNHEAEKLQKELEGNE